MAKLKTVFRCQQCGDSTSKWMGKCPSCGEWNSLVEEVLERDQNKVTLPLPEDLKQKSAPININTIDQTDEFRLELPDKELNRVLGGGLVPGSVTLVGGEPGIGKSTLLLQAALNTKDLKILYISGEESYRQIKMRADRIGIHNPNCFILNETSVQSIFNHINQIKPNIVVIDSIQTLHSSIIESSPGSISQIRECTSEIIQYSKKTDIPTFIIGHITKDGQIAGPKVLEHMVDTVLQFEGDRHHMYRLLRAVKNRFGASNELGIYEMHSIGLKEVVSPSKILISNRDSQLSGSAITATIEGIRPMLIEIQALVSTTAYSTPQRTSTGFDNKRLSMLLAVLEKRCGLRMAANDVFLNITGGIRVDDPAIDLSVICAILSSYHNMPIERNVCFAGEIGLSGEVRPVSKLDLRIKEVEKLGFKRLFIPKHNVKSSEIPDSTLDLVPVETVNHVFEQLFA